MNNKIGWLLWVALFSPVWVSADELYPTLCASCHGVSGAGDGPAVPAGVIQPRPFSAAAFKFDTDADWQKGTDADIANVIKNGTQYYGGSPLMPPWPTLSDDDVAGLIARVRSFSE